MGQSVKEKDNDVFKKDDHTPTLALDLDGVCFDNTKGWKGEDKFGKPIEGASVITNKLRDEGWKICIWTTRTDMEAIEKALDDANIVYDEINKNSDLDKKGGKIIADVYLDDRAVQFNGSWTEAYEAIQNFKPWYKK